MHKNSYYVDLSDENFTAIKNIKIDLSTQPLVVLIKNEITNFSGLAQFLTLADYQRAHKFSSLPRQQLFLVQRAYLRLLSAHLLNKKTENLTFAFSSFGKPFLVGDELYFNLSHSKNFTLYAFSKTQEIGIDIEEIDRNSPFSAIANLCCSNVELQELAQLPKQEQGSFFLNLWTRKEAISKAIGQGLNLDFRTIDVGVERRDFAFASSLFHLTDMSKRGSYSACLAEKMS